MKLADLLAQKQPLILERWRRLIFGSYPPETARFLQQGGDRFANPVGHRISQGLQNLLAALLKGMDSDRVLASLDEILRIQALQDFSPSQTLAFVFLLKQVLREALAPELRGADLAAEFLDLEARIDGVALLGFDVYMQRREKLFEVRVNEIKNRVSGLMRRTGLSLNNH